MTIEQEHYDALVIGAGPAGMSAAKAYSEEAPEARVLVIDAGNKSAKRRCPTLFQNRECKGCGGTCQIIEGIGGACSSVSCGMLSEYPAGSGQLDYWSEEGLLKLEQEILKWIEIVNGGPLKTVDPEIEPGIVKQAQDIGMSLKTYRSSEVEGAQFEKLMNALFEDMIGGNNVDTRFRSRVTDIREVHGKLCVITQDGQAIRANNVIFATGRAGNSKSTKILNKIGASITGANGYLGVRFETIAYERLIQMRDQVLDPKFKRNGTRMFCFCPQGKVVGMNVPNEMAHHYTEGKTSYTDSLEGCVWPNSPWGNFSVQTKVNFSSLAEWREWEKEMIIRHLEMSGGQLIAQSLASLINEEEPNGDTSDEGSSIPGRWRVGDIKKLIESPNGVDVVEEAVQFILDFNKIIGGGLVDKNNPAHVYAPELHIWPQFKLNSKMETTINGLYVVGDMSGVARGILQAMNMGRVAGLAAAGVNIDDLMGAALT